MSADVVFNGLNGASGGYFVTASPELIAEIAKGDQVNKEHLDDVRARLHDAEPSLGVVRTVQDPSDLTQTGWGVIFAEHADPAVREALQPLLSYRRQEAALRKENYYREYVGPAGYHAGETPRSSCATVVHDHQARPIWSRCRTTCLIVGDPETLAYGFQYQLDVQYAVGRICFDTVAEYASYAAIVVQAETASPDSSTTREPIGGGGSRSRTANPRPRRAVFVGVSNDGDRATQLSRQYLG